MNLPGEDNNYVDSNTIQTFSPSNKRSKIAFLLRGKNSLINLDLENTII